MRERLNLYINAMIYLITFSCYGCHLHGAESGSVDWQHRLRGSPLLPVDPERAAAERRRMDQSPYALDESRRAVVLAAIQEVCAFRGWQLFAAHVRSTHVHCIVKADARPERAMNDFKKSASRSLQQLTGEERQRKRWARHGSTRWLWKMQHISAAIRYVVDQQGVPMSVFEDLNL
jgi:REP element-mobilizing transposase RayT